METKYNDRPISMYDNLNMTTNISTMISAPKTKQPTMATSASPPPPIPASSMTKSNGAAVHSTPFADITFKFNDNNNSKPSQHQQPLQLQLNGNRNLNYMPAPNTSDLYTMPYKMANTSTPLALAKPSVSPAVSATTAATTATLLTPAAGLGNALTSSQLPTKSSSSSSSPSSAPSQPLANSQASNARLNERPLSQHSQSELNETTHHSIAAVKAALNEAKSKFFGLNGCTPYQHQQQQIQPHHRQQQKQQQQQPQSLYDHNVSQRQNLQPTAVDQNPKILQQPETQPQPQQLHQVQKPQPKYQNIPENSAIFRSHAPELPPKPLEYQNLQKQIQRQQPPIKSAAAISAAAAAAAATASAALPPSTVNAPATATATNIITNSPSSSMDTQIPQQQPSRKMSPGTTYNQIPLNDIDGPPRSQTVYMATTVPQNIKVNKIAGRHTPTRSSLRHSRMLVVTNKHYEEIQHPNPMGFRQANLARWLLILQILIGILLISLSIWIFVLAFNTPIQDNPYWCGLVLIFTGTIGLILVRYHRIQRNKTREHCFIFLRMDSYVLSLLSILLCCVALIFAAIHYCRITAQDTRCESGNMFMEHASCVCTFNVPSVNDTTSARLNSTAPLLENENDSVTDDQVAEVIADNSYKFEYRDLSCDEVMGPWTSILCISFVLNSLGFLVSLAYVVLLVCCRSSSKRSYTTVRTSTF